MADNVGYTPGAGASVAADDIGGHLHQRMKLITGQDGVNDGDVSEKNPMPISLKGGHEDVFHRLNVTLPSNDIDVQFFRAAPETLVDVTTANSATATQNVGGALFSSSTNANGSVQGVSRTSTVYRSGSEIFCLFTAAFTAGIANSYMRVGLYDANNGFFIGYEGTSFGITVRNNASDSTVAKASFSEDDLTGSTTSLFTRAGTAEAIDLTKLNVFRIRFGWLGSAPVYWEVMSPDGEWVVFHKTLFPNLQATPSIRDADLPVTLDITKTAAAATDLTIQTDCWGAGSTLQEQSGIIDLTNSRSASTLAGGATWNGSGPFVDIHRYSLTTILIDSASAESGTLSAEFSTDGTNVNRTVNYTVDDSSTHPPHTLIPVAQYMRVKFVADGASPTNDHSSFLVQTMHHVNKSAKLTSRLDSTVVDSTDVDNVRAVLMGKTGGGSYVNVGTTTGGNLKIDNEEIGGTAFDVNTGNAGAGTQRVVLASDQPVVSIDDNAGSITVDTAGGALDVSGATVTVDLGANNDVTIDGSGVVGTDAAAHGASQTGIRALGTDGTNDQQIAVDASGNVQVDIVADGAGLATAANQLPDGHNVTIDNAGAGAAVNIQDGGNSITVDTAGGALDVSGATVTVDLGANNDVTIDGSTSVGTDGSAHGASQTGLRAMGTDGTNDQQIAVDASGNVQVDIVADAAGLATAANQLPDGHNVTVDNAAGASAVNIQDGGNSITVDGAVTATILAGAGIAHDSTSDTRPQLHGGKSIDRGANPTEVDTAGDSTYGYFDRAGIQFITGPHPNQKTFRANYTGAQNDTAVVTATAGEKIVVTKVSVLCDNANSVDVQARVGLGASTTPTGDKVCLTHPGIAPGSGVIEGDGMASLAVGAADEDIRITSEVPTGGSIDVLVTYYEIAA